MSTIYADNIQPNLGSGVSIPGHVIQVVSADYSTPNNTTSGSFVDTGLSTSITPTNSSSKVLALVQCTVNIGGTGDNGCGFQLVREATNIWTSASGAFYNYASSGGTLYMASVFHLNYLDSPNSTSSVTYKLQFSARNGISATAQTGNTPSTITLMEIAQ